MRILFLIALAGCGRTPVDDSGTPQDTGGADTGLPAVECPIVTTSVCDDPASVIQGRVRLADGYSGPTSGSLFVAIAHQAYSGEYGGGYHISVDIPNVDLADGPVPFSLDMCGGSAMWSEENCDYGLIAILDANGNQSWENLLPDAGEPATRVADVTVSCKDEAGPCLDVVLGCTEGASCVQFTPPATCTCAEDSCPSDFALCF